MAGPPGNVVDHPAPALRRRRDPRTRPSEREREGHERRHDHERSDHRDGGIDADTTRRIQCPQGAEGSDRRGDQHDDESGRRREDRDDAGHRQFDHPELAFGDAERAQGRLGDDAAGATALDHQRGRDGGADEREQSERQKDDDERSHRLVDRLTFLAPRRLQLEAERTGLAGEVPVSVDARSEVDVARGVGGQGAVRVVERVAEHHDPEHHRLVGDGLDRQRADADDPDVGFRRPRRVGVVEADVQPLTDREVAALGGAGGDEHLVRRVRPRESTRLHRREVEREAVTDGREQRGGEDVVHPVRRAGEPGIHALVDDTAGGPEGSFAPLRIGAERDGRIGRVGAGEDPVVGGVGPPCRREARERDPEAQPEEEAGRHDGAPSVGESPACDDDDRPQLRLVHPATVDFCLT